MAKPIRIGALISGTGSNLEAIMSACADGALNGEVVFAGTDNPEAAGLKKAAARSIPTFAVDYAGIIRRYRENPGASPLPEDFDFDEISRKQTLVDSDSERNRFFLHTRAIAEAELLRRISEHPFDLLVLAGFMRNLTPYFIDRVNTEPGKPRIMNIHPALLPAFPGTDGYGDTFRYGCKVGGCTVHFIDYGEDSGPIIGQKAFEIREDDTIDTIRQKGLTLEWELYPRCIQLFAENRLSTVKMTYTGPDKTVRQRTIVRIAANAPAP